MELSRPLAIADGGADSLDDEAETVTLSPDAWERFNAEAVWCSLEGVNDRAHALRFAVNRPHAVLEVEIDGRPRERVIVPATMATSWFWNASRLYSLRPFAPAEIDHARYLDAVDAWAQGEALEGDDLPRALRLRLGRGEEVMRHDYLLEHAGGWLRGRRFAFADAPEVIIDEFDMRDLVYDISALLAESLSGE